MNRVSLGPEVLEDLRQLPSDELRLIALRWLRRIERAPELGQPLDRRISGDLSACRKIYFGIGDEPHRLNFIPRRLGGDGPRYRIVYRPSAGGKEIEILEVIAIGPKYGDAGVYERAVRRLERDDPRSG